MPSTYHTCPDMSSTVQLTDKEQALYDSICEGMDEPKCGWLHEVTPFKNDHVTAAVLGSLITKGLVTSSKDDEDCYWIEAV